MPVTGCHLADPEKGGHHNLKAWRVIISQAIRQRTLSLWLQPMVNEGRLMPVYHQVFSRIDSAEGALKAGTFLPMAERFGVGGVPFSYLRNLRFQGLRIDNSFIHDVDTHEDNRSCIEPVVAIAHSRGLKVFATGVETAAEYSVLC
ncbi:EAL domain-containing protein [Marinobacter sp. es.048]|nr:EAL domain-containing protein [Marinobacter sp. es.048]